MLKNPQFGNGLGMTIHIRTKISSWWSSIENAVIQVGDQLIEIMGGANDGGGPRYWINGLPGSEDVMNDENIGMLTTAFKEHFPGFVLNFRKVKDEQFRFRMSFGNGGDAIGLETYKEFVSVRVKVHPKNGHAFQGSTSGMMGSYPDGALLSRSGELITDPIAFGKEWQVRTNEEGMLFHSVEGVQYPMECAMPAAKTIEETTKRRRRLGESLVTQEDAELACYRVGIENFHQCVYDGNFLDLVT